MASPKRDDWRKGFHRWCDNDWCDNDWCDNDWCDNDWCDNDWCDNDWCDNDLYRISDYVGRRPNHSFSESAANNRARASCDNAGWGNVW